MEDALLDVGLLEVDAMTVMSCVKGAHRGHYLLLDARGEPAWRERHLEHAVPLPAAGVEKLLPFLGDVEQVFVYGEDGGDARALRVALALAEVGLDVRVLRGGLQTALTKGASSEGTRPPPRLKVHTAHGRRSYTWAR